jgi:hypothetical protein
MSRVHGSDIGTLALWLIVMVGVVLSWIVAARLHRELRVRNRDLWIQLGSPSFFSSSRKLRRFGASDSARLLGDRLSGLLRMQTAVNIGTGVAVLAFLVLTLIING